MQPVGLLGGLLALWALLHFWLVPLVQDRWSASSMREKMTRAGALVALEKIRDLSAACAVAVAVVVLIVLIAGWLSIAGVTWPKLAIDLLASLYAGAKTMSEGYGAVVTALGLAGACLVLWMTARRARARVAAAWTDAARETYASFVADPQKIDAARTDSRLAPFVEQVDAAVARALAAQEQDPVSETALATANAAVGDAMSRLAVAVSEHGIDFAAAAGTPTAKESEPTPRRTRWQRLMAALVSKRLGEDLGLGSKWLGRAVTALLFVSLTGWAAEPLADSLRLTVNNLRVQVVGQEAQRNLEQELSRAPAAQDQTEVDDSALPPNAAQTASRLVARAAMHQMTRAPLLDSAAGIRRARAAEAEFVRAALNQQRLAAAGDTVSAVRAEAAAKAANAATDVTAAAAQHIEAAAQPAMEELKRRDPARLSRLIRQLEARYSAPMTPVDAQGKLMAKVLDEAFSSVDLKPDGELAKQAQKVTKDFGKKAVKSWADAAVKQLVADALRGAAQADVVRGFAFEVSGGTQDFIRTLAEREGRGWQPGGLAAEEDRVARAVANKVSALYGDASEQERQIIRERLGGYGGLFPQDEGPLPRSADAPEPHVATGGGGNGGSPNGERPQRGSPAKAHAQAMPQFAQSRATSFHMASRSFRVRGVLVGRDIEGPTLDATDVRWRLQPPSTPGQATRVVLELRVAESLAGVPKWRHAGSFDAGIVNQALRYAADRRVVATTITGGDPRAVRRLTYLHPALLDTPLGCRIVEADRWVDTFTSTRNGFVVTPGLAVLSADREAMGQWLGIVDVAERVASTRAPNCPVNQVRALLERRKLGKPVFSSALVQAMESFITAQAGAEAGSDRLLRHATACAANDKGDLAECLCSNAATGLPAHYWFPEDHTSQVRERVARLDAELAWMRPSPDRLGHLDFWTHTTFSLRSGNTGESDEARTAALDFPTPMLEALRVEVAKQLPAHLSTQLRSTSYDDFMRPLEEFVLAQRLMRAALSGRLGRDFPMAKLLALADETQRFVKKQPTIRWEAAGSPRELMETLKSADPTAAQRYLDFLSDQRDRSMQRRPVCDAASN